MRASSNGSAVLCRPRDSRLGAVWSERGGFEQWENDPPMVVIGRDTSDEACVRLAQRFGLEATHVIAFRDQSDAF